MNPQQQQFGQPQPQPGQFGQQPGYQQQQQFGQSQPQPGQFGQQPGYQQQQHFGQSQPQPGQFGQQPGYQQQQQFGQQGQFDYGKTQQIGQPQAASTLYSQKMQGLNQTQFSQISTPGVQPLPSNVVSNNYNYNPNSSNQWQKNQFSSYGMNVSPEEMNEMQLWFSAVDSDRSGSISDYELQRALSYSGFIFNIKIAQRLIKVFDVDNSNHLNFQEFVPLHRFLKQLKKNFENTDTNRTGTIDPNELQYVLSLEGFNITKMDTINKLFTHFAYRTGANHINFEQFVELVCFLGHCRTMFNNYAGRNPSNVPGRINIDINDFIDIVSMICE